MSYEKRDNSLKVLTGAAIIVVVLLLVAHLVVTPLYRRGRPREPQPLLPATQSTGPGLAVNLSGTLRDLRARERAVLDSYGWVDRSNGIVRMPVERAIEMLGKRGAP